MEVPGLGSALVSGESEGDTFRVSRDGRITEQTIGAKQVMHRCAAGDASGVRAIPRAGADEPSGKTARKKKIVAAIRETADRLGNTPAICRASYISPAVLDQFERGRVVERHFQDVEELLERRRGGLHPSERALLALLRERAA